MWFTIINTYSDGELRYWEVFARSTEAALSIAKARDAKDYPDRQSDWENYSILRGHNLALVHH